MNEVERFWSHIDKSGDCVVHALRAALAQTTDGTP